MTLSLQPGTQFGPFTVVGELGRGAMGAVLRVRDSAQRELALKILTRNTNAKQLQRFLREAEVTASLRHPGIVLVHDAGFVGELAYIAYDLVEGSDLEQTFDSLSRDQLLDLVLQVARALGHAHSHGVIHRDVKPSNVLVSTDGTAKLADFGLAQASGLERLTRSGATLGTPNYMAPEQIVGKRDAYGPPTDVWALGVLLYRALTKCDPFSGQSWVQLMTQISSVEPKPPRALDPEVDLRLQQVCLKALCKAPANRYPNAGAFAADLQRALDGQSVEAAHAPRAKLPLPLLLALVALVSVVALTAAAAWALRSSSDPRPDAPARTLKPRVNTTTHRAELERALALLDEGALPDADLHLRRLLAKASPDDLRPLLHTSLRERVSPEQLEALTVLLGACSKPGYDLGDAAPVADAVIAAATIRIETDVTVAIDTIEALARAGAHPTTSRNDAYALIAVAYNTLAIGMLEVADYNRLLVAAVELDLPFQDRQLESDRASFEVSRKPGPAERYVEMRVSAARSERKRWNTTRFEALLRSEDFGPLQTADGLKTVAYYATPQRAAELLHEASALDPTNPYLLRILALHLSRQAKPAEAKAMIERALKVYYAEGFDEGPDTMADLTKFHSAQVIVHANAGERDEARAIYYEALYKDDESLVPSLPIRYPWLETSAR